MGTKGMNAANDAVRKLYLLNKQQSKIKMKMQELREALEQYFDSKSITELVVDSDPDSTDLEIPKKISAKMVTSLSVEYDAEKLREALDPEVYNEIIDKNYYVRDFQMLLKLFKKAGYSSEQLKQCIGSTHSVNRTKVQHLYSIGDITASQMKGTYTARVSKSLRIRALK